MIRLTLFSHGSTAALRRAAFPGDEPLDARGMAAAEARAGTLGAADRILVSPALRARQTAAALRLPATVDEALRDADYGRWTGATLTEIATREPAAVSAWLRDPTTAPHGGEPLAALLARAGAWLAARAREDGRLIAITHAAFMRAAIVQAIGAPAAAFWRIDIAPLTLVSLHGGAAGWRLRAIVEAGAGGQRVGAKARRPSGGALAETGAELGPPAEDEDGDATVDAAD